MAEHPREQAEPSDFAPAYAMWRGSPLGRVTEEIERTLILEMLGEVHGKRILDIGCGDGELAVALSKRGANVCGVDLSAKAIEAARERAREKGADIRFEVVDAQNLPYSSGAFDAVIAITVLCFVEKPDAILNEAVRTLRPGGRLVIGELGRWNLWVAKRRIRGWMGNPLWRKARFRTAREFRALLEGAGFVVETVRGAVYYPPWGVAARLFAPFDSWLGRSTTLGAAFIAVAATKPGSVESASCSNYRASFLGYSQSVETGTAQSRSPKSTGLCPV